MVKRLSLLIIALGVLFILSCKISRPVQVQCGGRVVGYGHLTDDGERSKTRNKEHFIVVDNKGKKHYYPRNECSAWQRVAGE